MRKKRLKKALLLLTIGTFCVPCAVMGVSALQDLEPVLAVAETTIEYTAPTAKEGLVYNGQEQELINAGIVPDGYTMLYRFYFDVDTETTEIPTGKDYGAWMIQYKIVDGENNVVFDCGNQEYIFVNISQAPLTVKADDITVEQYNWEAYRPTYTVEGFIGDDNFSDSYGAKPEFQYFDNFDTVGEYELLFNESKGWAQNYTITFVPGKITVYEHTDCRGGEKWNTCCGNICYYCEAFYGEPTEGAHNWDSDSGLCYYCETPCPHEEQTVYCIGSYCEVCDFNCDETKIDENHHKWNQWGYCDYCYLYCEHESYNLTTAECDVCKNIVKDVAVIVGESITLYDDLFDGIANAPENATVKLLRGRMCEDSYEINTSITIDLNGNWIENVSLGGISVNAPIVVIDSVGGGGFAISTYFHALSVLKGGCYRYLGIYVEGKTHSDFLGKGYHYYENQDGVGKDTPMTDEAVADGYSTWVLFDCTHTFGDWTTTKPATKTEKGEETRICNICEKTESREVPVLEDSSDNTPSGGEQGGLDNNDRETKKGCKSSLSYVSALGLLAICSVCVKTRKRKE